MSTKKKPVKVAKAKPAKASGPRHASAPKPGKAAKASSVKPAKAAKTAPKTQVPAKAGKPVPAPRKAAPSPAKKIAKTPTVTAKKTPVDAVGTTHASSSKKSKTVASKAEKPLLDTVAPASVATPAADVKTGGAPRGASKPTKTTLDDLTLDVEEKDELLEQEKRDLAKALSTDADEDEPLETAFVPTDTSERFILVVDEEGQRRNETVTIVQQILPNAVVEVADDPEEAFEVMQDCDFDTYVVNFLMPGFSASPFVKSVANHPDHPLLIGFAADKISDALDQRKGLKIIPLKRLFDLDVNAAAEPPKEKLGGLLED